MGIDRFLPKSKALIVQYINQNVLEEGETWLSKEDVFVVWYSKTLQNAKAILSAPGPNLPLFEMTYNGTDKDIYMDVYHKTENRKIHVGPKREGVGKQ